MNKYIMTSYMIDVSNWLKSDGASFCEENNIDINAFKLASQLDILACNWKGEKKGYSLVGPDRCIVVKKGEK